LPNKHSKRVLEEESTHLMSLHMEKGNQEEVAHPHLEAQEEAIEARKRAQEDMKITAERRRGAGRGEGMTTEETGREAIHQIITAHIIGPTGVLEGEGQDTEAIMKGGIILDRDQTAHLGSITAARYIIPTIKSLRNLKTYNTIITLSTRRLSPLLHHLSTTVLEGSYSNSRPVLSNNSSIYSPLTPIRVTFNDHKVPKISLGVSGGQSSPCKVPPSLLRSNSSFF
jgi:hypothetical protein